MLKICKSIDKVEKARTSFNNGREIKGNVREIEHDDVKFRQSKAWSFPVDNLCQFLPPSEIYESALSGIFGGGKWFTEFHIESCGDESVSVTMFGKKNCIYAERGQPTDWPVKSLKSISRFVHMAVKGPPIEWGDWMYFCLTRKDSLFVQPALVGHVVLTIEGPSFVVGWEAACASDSQRLATASSRYAFGVGTKEQRLFRFLASEEQDVLLPQIPGDCGAELGREKAVTGAKKKWNPKRGQNPSSACSDVPSKEIGRKNVSIAILCAIFVIIFLQFVSLVLVFSPSVSKRKHAHCNSPFQPIWRA